MKRIVFGIALSLLLSGGAGCSKEDPSPQPPSLNAAPTTSEAAADASRNARLEAAKAHSKVINDEFQDALEPLTFAIENWEPDTEGLYMAYWDRGIAYDGLGQPKKAIQDFTSAIELEDSAYLYHARAIAYCLAADYHAALLDCETAYEKLPAEPYNALLLSQLLSCSPLDADRDGERALDLASQELDHSPERMELVACAMAEAGKFHDAIQLTEMVLEHREKWSDDSQAHKDAIRLTRSRLEVLRSGKPIRLSTTPGEWRKPWESF
ncbi:hypothetical protein [Aeoliella sp.]|uniref:hypothetical protein n=1 Tax=Aeoliella sp. TaxID=2795800 RepID=UPI003CCC449E